MMDAQGKDFCSMDLLKGTSIKSSKMASTFDVLALEDCTAPAFTSRGIHQKQICTQEISEVVSVHPTSLATIVVVTCWSAVFSSGNLSIPSKLTQVSKSRYKGFIQSMEYLQMVGLIIPKLSSTTTSKRFHFSRSPTKSSSNLSKSELVDSPRGDSNLNLQATRQFLSIFFVFSDLKFSIQYF
jgi:cytosine/uracil/thiamine/allantoin permease